MDTQDVFPGTSETAQRMRALDWSKTPLGPVDTWPAALKTTVATSLECAFPIVLWWGPELAILYNDEYLPMLGPKHPDALGQPGAKVWAEIWDVISPMLSQVVEHAKPTRSRDLLLHIDRGYPEEAYFSFSYSQIHGEQGAVDGIFCPVIETTDKVIGERRLRTLRDLASRCKGAPGQDAAFERAAEILGANPQDVPFALIYRVDATRRSAELAASVGIERGTSASPEYIAFDDESHPWWIPNVVQSKVPTIVADLRSQFGNLPAGAWKIAPHCAIVSPVLLPGQDDVRAVLVAAVSPMRALDEQYRAFFELVSAQIASALADAMALEEERRRAEALAEIDRAKTAFFSNVSHEFRTPLTLMLGPLQEVLANQDRALSTTETDALAVVHRNSLRLLKLVNTLLDFSRIEAGRMEASYEPVDLATFTTDLVSMFQSAIEKAGLRLVLETPPLPEPVYVDREMWEKVVLNLLSNAFKFTFEGEIAVSLTWHGSQVELRVADTGIGVGPADLSRLFRRFERIRHARARTHEGSGIGLALVHELVRLHGGSVDVESVEGKGTTFSVRVPTGIAHLPANRLAPVRQTATSPGANSYVEEALRWLPSDGRHLPTVRDSNANETPSAIRPARVLIADDNTDMREYLARLIGDSHVVTTVSDGASALAEVQQSPPDLVLSDVMMPGLDGFELVAAIRADPRTRQIPLILLSARAGEEARIEGLRAGADDYMVKPFSGRELLARVSSQLQMARMRQENDRRKDEFLALLAHELRNPLAPIRTGLELIRLSGDTPHAVNRVRMMMERQVGQMVRLIDDLLDVSRITSGKIVLQRAPAQLSELIQIAIDGQRPAMDARDIAFGAQLSDVPCTVDVDAIRFVQILSNVLNNATKFTPREGRIHLSTEVSAHPSNPSVAIRIADTGVGISQESLSHIFELFTQTPATQPSNGGLGIGLALARRLAEMHGGQVTAQSDGPGLGSTFTIRLPLSDTQEPAVAAPASRPDATTRRVVIIDDNRDAATTMAILIEELGGTARTAHDAVHGLETIRQFKPDIVFMDIGMPEMDGYEACRRIRRERSLRDVVIVAVTGWGQSQDKQRAIEAGFDAHLTKPVDLEMLESLLSGKDTRAHSWSSQRPSWKVAAGLPSR